MRSPVVPRLIDIRWGAAYRLSMSAAVDERLGDFFSSGAQIAWLINPEKQCVEVCHSLTDRRMIGREVTVNGEHLLPGFQFPVADLFKEWDWE